MEGVLTVPGFKALLVGKPKESKVLGSFGEMSNAIMNLEEWIRLWIPLI